MPQRLDLSANSAVAEVLAAERLCMHSDLAIPLEAVDRRLAGRGVRAWFPSSAEYSYELRHTEAGVIFLIGYGMRGLSLRIEPKDAGAAEAAGAFPDSVFGPGWFVFECFGSDCRSQLPEWSERSHAAAERL